jgi:DNA polymerase
VESKGITEVRGRIFNERIFDLAVAIIPTYHPAAALYNPGYRAVLEEDFQMVKTELEKSV